ncbi:MAG: CPBP family intramembrane metalloprotease [Acaryochloridaceae cyanobacterium CSU_3_4]|nr:CPBP family intramembrane metalloprotease [Acaryochloridaceae cyanobacterium CSU_3_4]
MKKPATSPSPPWTSLEILGLTIAILVIFFTITSAIATLFLTLTLNHNPSLNPQVVAQSMQTNGWVLSIAILIAGSCSLVLLYATLTQRPALTPSQYLALRKPRWTAWWIWNALLVALMLLSESILRTFQQPETYTETLYRTTHSPILLYIAIVGIAPLFEELLFRGFLFHGLQSSRLGSGGAILISALIWTILHAQYGGLSLVQIFVFGLLFGAARTQTQSLFIPLSMHCLNNFLVLSITSMTLP